MGGVKNQVLGIENHRACVFVIHREDGAITGKEVDGEQSMRPERKGSIIRRIDSQC